jgi:hypothetical protein
MVASIWNGSIQFLSLGLVGTFILKRFPTSFAIGFLLGLVVVFMNQNLIYFSAFSNYNQRHSGGTNPTYVAFSIVLVIVLAIFGTLLFHFKQYVIVAPIDAKGFGRKPTTALTEINNNTSGSNAPVSTYQRYDDGSET